MEPLTIEYIELIAPKSKMNKRKYKSPYSALDSIARLITRNKNNGQFDRKSYYAIYYDLNEWVYGNFLEAGLAILQTPSVLPAEFSKLFDATWVQLKYVYSDGLELVKKDRFVKIIAPGSVLNGRLCRNAYDALIDVSELIADKSKSKKTTECIMICSNGLPLTILRMECLY